MNDLFPAKPSKNISEFNSKLAIYAHLKLATDDIKFGKAQKAAILLMT